MSVRRTSIAAAALGAVSVLFSQACAGHHTAVTPTTSADVTTTSAESTTTTSPSGKQVLPAGSSVMVRTSDAISTESATVGTPFTGTLESPIRDSNGDEIVKAGARAFGRVVQSEGGGHVKKPRLAISAMSIESGGKTIPIQTSPAGAEGSYGGGIAKIGAGTLIGAVVGAPLAGAAAGTGVVLLSGKNQIVIPAQTLVEFKTSEATTLR
jgi:hypothetical protein